MARFKICLLILLILIFSTIGASETKTLTIKKESGLKHATIVFLASIPLTLTMSMLSYKFYKMYQTSDANYSLNKVETRNTIYIGISLSLVYSVVDYINYKKKMKNGNKIKRKRSSS